MFRVDLSTRECDGRVIVALRGELDVLDAAGVAGALAAVTVREPPVILDLAVLGFINASGLAALVSARKHARRAPGVTCCWPRRSGGCLRCLPSPACSIFSASIPAWKRPFAAPGSRSRWPRRWAVLSSWLPHDPGRVLHGGVALEVVFGRGRTSAGRGAC